MRVCSSYPISRGTASGAIAAAAEAVNGKTEMQALIAYLQGLGHARSGR